MGPREMRDMLTMKRSKRHHVSVKNWGDGEPNRHVTVIKELSEFELVFNSNTDQIQLFSGHAFGLGRVFNLRNVILKSGEDKQSERTNGGYVV